MGSDWPDGSERAVLKSRFIASLREQEGYLPERIVDLLVDNDPNNPREIQILLKGVERRLLDDAQLPNEADWQSVEQSLVALPESHLFRWYFHFYKAAALAEQGAFHLAKVEGERSLSQALSLRSSDALLASLGLLSALGKANGDFEEALHYVELFHKQRVKREGPIKQEVQLAQEEPRRVKKSNNRLFYMWLSLGLVIMISFGWYWLPFRVVWEPGAFGRNAAGGAQGAMVSWVNSNRQYEDDAALTDEEIVVDEAKVELLARLRGHKLITNDDWLAFQQLFNRIHPDFLIHLRFKHKGITPAEEKLACLIRVHFSTREIAKLLAVSVNSVNISRYRLRKRCKIEGDITLEEYLMRY